MRLFWHGATARADSVIARACERHPRSKCFPLNEPAHGLLACRSSAWQLRSAASRRRTATCSGRCISLSPVPSPVENLDGSTAAESSIVSLAHRAASTAYQDYAPASHQRAALKSFLQSCFALSPTPLVHIPGYGAGGGGAEAQSGQVPAGEPNGDGGGGQRGSPAFAGPLVKP